jgi:hypothetical protein
MADDGLGLVDMTGRWVGFYPYLRVQIGAFPMTAELRQEGNRIIGEMYDQITEHSELLERFFELRRDELSSTGRSQIEWAIHQFGAETVVVNWRLPDTSDFEGRITGDRVEFTKTYRGSFEGAWAVGGREIGSVERRGHRVQYSGHLDREKGFIAGEWFIRRSGLFGRILPPESREFFELYNKT